VGQKEEFAKRFHPVTSEIRKKVCQQTKPDSTNTKVILHGRVSRQKSIRLKAVTGQML
jgi:hypothetical protein